MYSINLLKETLDKLKEYDKTPEDVLWVGDSYNEERYTTWEDFVNKSNFHYLCGGEDVYVGLIIVGEDWWLERRNKSDYEWWDFKKLPVKPKNKSEISNILVGEDYWNCNFWIR